MEQCLPSIASRDCPLLLLLGGLCPSIGAIELLTAQTKFGSTFGSLSPGCPPANKS